VTTTQAGTPPDTRTLAERFAAHAGVEAPPGMVLGWRVCHRDLRSRNGYRWPWPGGRATDPRKGVDRRKTTAPHNACPSDTLGGVCIAKTFGGAASGGIPAGTILVTAHHPKDVLGEDPDKLRVKRALVLDVVDLVSALGGADLGGANLRYADLRYANLGGADLGGANLGCADLGYADLGGANLRYADLGGANLGYADLRCANLGCADLRCADLGGADLRYADLGGADLRYADLRCADLRYADATQLTLWPAGFDPAAAGVVVL
jgi:hypothetical protein